MDDKTITNLKHPEDHPPMEEPINRAWGDDFHYRALFEQSDDSIFIISLGLRYMAANPQALQLLGYTGIELTGKPVSEVMALDESLGHATVEDDSSNLVERILRRKDGTLVPVEISTSIVTMAPASRSISRALPVISPVARKSNAFFRAATRSWSPSIMPARACYNPTALKIISARSLNRSGRPVEPARVLSSRSSCHPSMPQVMYSFSG